MPDRKMAARPNAWQRGGRAGWNNGQSGRRSSSLFSPVVVTAHKRGKGSAVLAKFVMARPLNEPVVAMVYRHRPCPNHVSLPPKVLALARERGCHRWVVRDDAAGHCYGLFLPNVEAVGWLHDSEGGPEWFVALAAFDRIAWQGWPFVTESIHVDLLDGVVTCRHTDGQLQLFEEGAA